MPHDIESNSAPSAEHGLWGGFFSSLTFQLLEGVGWWLAVAKFIDHERECCPFYRYEIALEPERGPLWLKLTGREWVKELMRGEMLRLIQPDVARAANLH